MIAAKPAATVAVANAPSVNIAQVLLRQAALKQDKFSEIRAVKEKTRAKQIPVLFSFYSCYTKSGTSLYRF